MSYDSSIKSVTFYKLILIILLVITFSGISSLIYHPLYLFFPGLLAFALLPLWVRPRFLVRFKNLILFCVLLGIIVFCIIGTAFVSKSFFRSIAFIAFYTIPFFFLVVDITSLEKFIFINSLILTAIIIILYFAWQFFSGRIGRWELEGLFGGPNTSALTLNMIWPILLGYGLSKKKRYYKIFLLLLVQVSIITAVLFFSRMNIFCSFLMLSTYLWIKLKKRRSFVLLIIVFFSISLLLFYCNDIYNFLIDLNLIGYKPQHPRMLIWALSVEQICRHPFWGVGAGNASDALAIINIYHAHNNIIHTALELGIPIGIIMIFFEIYILKTSIKTLFLNHKKSDFLKKEMSLSMLAWVLFSITDTPIEYPSVSLLLVYCIRWVRK